MKSALLSQRPCVDKPRRSVYDPPPTTVRGPSCTGSSAQRWPRGAVGSKEARHAQRYTFSPVPGVLVLGIGGDACGRLDVGAHDHPSQRTLGYDRNAVLGPRVAVGLLQAPSASGLDRGILLRPVRQRRLADLSGCTIVYRRLLLGSMAYGPRDVTFLRGDLFRRPAGGLCLLQLHDAGTEQQPSPTRYHGSLGTLPLLGRHPQTSFLLDRRRRGSWIGSVEQVRPRGLGPVHARLLGFPSRCPPAMENARPLPADRDGHARLSASFGVDD